MQIYLIKLYFQWGVGFCRCGIPPCSQKPARGQILSSPPQSASDSSINRWLAICGRTRQRFVASASPVAILLRCKCKRIQSLWSLVVCLWSLAFLCGFSFLSDLKNEKGNALYKKGQVVKAKSEYLSAMKSDPKSPEIAYNLGNAFYKEGSFKESLSAYQKAAQNQNDADFQSKAFYNLGNSLYRNQDLDKAIEGYKQALRLNSRDEDVKYNLELLLKKKQKDQNQQQDQKKDQQKQDQQQNQGQQKKQDQGGSSGGGSNGAGSQSQGSNEQQKSGGQGQEQNKPEQNKSEEKQGGQNKQEEEKEKRQEGQAKKEGEKQQGESSAGEQQDQKEEKKQEQNQTQEAGVRPEEEKDKDKDKQETPSQSEMKPKSDADIRADQILNALENQEQQVLKFQNDPKNPQIRGRRVAEQDW